MIHKLKKKFTVLATVSMLVLMTALLAMMNLINYTSVVSESDEILDVLQQPEVQFFDKIDPPNEPQPNRNMDAFIPRGMSPEVPYESRFFSVTVDADGTVLQSDLSQIISVDADSVQMYIEKAVGSAKSRAFVGAFRFLKTEKGAQTTILFLDCGRKLDAFRRFLRTSVGVGILGCLIVFGTFLFAAGKIVKPIAESYEKQKRFISDAGHEIKTPLTIINANVDLLACDGDKEELTDIRQQTERLTKLTNDLVFLSKMEENEHQLTKMDLPFSDIVSETANAFHAVALGRGLDFSVRVTPNITVNGAPDAIRQLVSILLENAIKYAPKGGRVSLNVSAHKKTAVLTVTNDTQVPLSDEDLSHVFERFYRTDASRNSATGGHGIGLSIAKAIVDAHGGSIHASTENGLNFCITASFS